MRDDFEDIIRERKDRDILKRLYQYVLPYKKEFLLVFILMAISVAVQLLPPFLIGYTVDTIANETFTQSDKLIRIIILSVVFLVSIVVSNIANYLQSITLQRIGQQTVVTLRDEVFTHIESLSIGQINEVPVGKLVTRTINDTNTVSEMYTSVIVNLIKNVLYISAILVALFIISYRLTLWMILILPVVIVTSFIFRRFSRMSYRRVRANIAEVNAFLSENLSGMKVTQIFNQEQKKKDEFVDKTSALRKSYLREILVFGIYRPTIYLMAMFGTVIVLYVGYQEVMAGIITAGFLFTYYTLVGDFFQPIQQLAEEFNIMQSAFASAEKIFDVLDTPPTIVDAPDAIDLPTFSGEIEFKDVWFKYIEDEWVLRGVSFKVNPGDTVAFVGATGSGKTTILSLIVRNYDIQKGQILIDGIDIKKIKRSSLRSHIGQMLQDVFLFNETIKNNITLNDDNITDEAVIQASEYVGANTFIDKLPDKYEHIVLERGNNFSSGQRQLISFARALVYEPSLMILDEATANIDSETEELIQESMQKMMNISTMIVVAHRLSTIQYSDKIILMQKGEIKEEGNHQELLRQKGLYYNLYQLQYDEALQK
ncbi:MAG: ABC transporter ATP-binding protein [Acholeplasmataceae bacterium]|nr:ABC transporter ATP-binding protein/permease [Acholeplasmataceae bacterium]